MDKQKRVQTKTLNHKKVNYIEYVEDGLTYYTTTFIQVRIPNNYEDVFESVGGYTRDVLYTKAKDLNPDTITVLTTVAKYDLPEINIIFEKDGKVVKELVSLEEVFLLHIIKLFVSKESIIGKVTVENSLDYSDHPVYGKYLDNYKEPKHINQSGIEYQGKSILFGEKVIIKGLTNMQDRFTGEMQEIVRDDGIDCMRVTVKDAVGALGIATVQEFLKEDGSVYTMFDKLKLDKKGSGLTDEEILAQEVQEEVDSELTYLNRLIKRKKGVLGHSGLSEEEVYQKVEDFKERQGYFTLEERVTVKIKEELQEPFVVLLTRRGLNELLKDSRIELE